MAMTFHPESYHLQSQLPQTGEPRAVSRVCELRYNDPPPQARR